MNDQLIKSIKIDKLFGLYTYRIPERGAFSSAAILYGDNGVGKSTILRLAFHLLSAANDKGHRGALYDAQFENIEVELTSGVTIRAKFIPDLQTKRFLRLDIVEGNKTLAVWDFHPKQRPQEEEAIVTLIVDSSGRVIQNTRETKKREIIPSVPTGNEAFISVLSKLVPTVFVLTAERRLDGDSVSDLDEIDLRGQMRLDRPMRISEMVGRLREVALSQAMESASTWVGKKAVIGANQGSMNVHSVYIDVLQHVMSPSAPDRDASAQKDTLELLRQLSLIETKTTELSRYELATELSTADFRKALTHRSKKNKELAAELLKPYIKSLEGRLHAVEPIYKVVDKLVGTVNDFLRDKEISFKLSQGIEIRNKLGHTLSPSQLSSGEQQLLLLFCYVLTARDQPSVFMIDEPEISLNVKWQRKLVQSLLDITDGATIQFIFASHSIELLAQHRNKVVKLEDKT